ncbi:hypothetical protein [Pannonibacter phragmitetus]|uniref:hypothetical protein n=1 Tax=Pannonibacter phragmitetus TaxID=121719 RepID=UPI0013DDB4C2|nr:hypothetical protein [Pannonibacter phragmitetus]
MGDLNLTGGGQAEEAGSDSGCSRFQGFRPRTLDGCRTFMMSLLARNIRVKTSAKQRTNPKIT